MYKILFSVALLFAVAQGMAQKRGTIKGKIIDSLSVSPVEFATVAVVDMRDTLSTLIAYTLSDKQGTFALHNIPEGVPVKVLISYVAYQPYRKFFTLNKGEQMDMGFIKMNSKQLKEVVIKGERMPITIRKDTIIFDAEAFKTRPNAVVEDLLKKLPGVEVDYQGNITVMAKKVSKVLVDGKEFFASDSRIATKNLDADMISKVQIYDDREDDPDHVKPESQLNKIIDLKFKKALKKSIFGKVYGGEGTDDHYQAGGLFNMFRDTLQVSLLGNTNNLNNTGFDFGELYSSGGLDRGGEAISRSGLGFGGFAGGNGKQTATAGGININTDYGKKLKVNLAYLYRRNKTEFNTITNRQQFFNDTTAVTNSIADRLNTSGTHSISSTVTWHPNDATQIRYLPLVNITQNNAMGSNTANSYSNFINPINNSVSSSTSNGNTFQFQQSFNYNHQLKKKGASINIDHSLYVNPGNSTNYNNDNLVSYIASFPSYTLRRVGDNNNRNTDANLSVSYRYPVTKKLTVDVSASTDYNNTLDKVSTYNYNPVTGQYDSFLLEQSSDLTRNKWTQILNPGITYNFPKDISLVAHLSAQYQQVNNVFRRNSPDLDQHYLFLLPNVSVNIKSFSVSYNRSAQLPNIGDMIPYSVVFSPLYSVTGNPDLKPTTRDNFNISYSKYKYQSGISMNVNAGAAFEQNSIFRQRTVNAQLAETSMPINRDGRYSYNAGGYLNKRFKKQNNLQISMMTNLSLSTTHDFFVLNHQDGYQDNYRINLSERLSLNWKDIVEIDPQYAINQTYTTYSGVSYNNQNYLMHNIDTYFSVNLPKKLNIEGNYTYRYNPLVPQGFQKSSNLLNMSLAHQFLKKDRAEVKLSCYDILNQNVNTTRYINENVITDTQSQIIRRYFMLTLQFKFNKSTVKEEAKPSLGGLMIRPR